MKNESASQDPAVAGSLPASKVIGRLAEAMKSAAETGMEDRLLRQINFKSLATAAYLAIRADLKDSAYDD